MMLIKKYPLLFLLFFAATLRYFFAFVFYGSYDTTYVNFYSIITNCGLGIYRNTNFPHPPFWFYLIKLAFSMEKILRLPLYYLIKFYSIIADVCIVYLLYHFPKIHKVNIGLLYSLSPVSLLITSFHAQQDPLLLFFLLLSAILLVIYKEKIIGSALIFGGSFLFKLWPFFVLPAFFSHINSWKRRFLFLSFAFLLVSISFLPYIIGDLPSLIRNVFGYGSTSDFGISLLLNLNPLSSSLKSFLSPFNTLFILIGSVIISFIGIKRKLNIFQTITTVLLFFYIFSLKVAAQYLVWLIPFGLITSKRSIKFYTITATVALIVNYLGNHSNAFTQMSYYQLFTPGTVPLPWGISLSLWWLISAMWFFYNIAFLKGAPIKLQKKIKTGVKPHVFIYISVSTIILGVCLGYFFKFTGWKGIENIYQARYYFNDISLKSTCEPKKLISSLEEIDNYRQNLTHNYSENFKNIKIPITSLLLILSLL